MNSAKTICVYCSSSDALDPAFYEAAETLGTAIARQGHALIYGGSRTGLMGTVARTVHECGGRVIGVMPELMASLNYDGLDETIITPGMRERKAVMEQRADAFVALPGGFGTLEEVLEILTLKQLRYHSKPLVLVNTLGYYDHLIRLFEHIYEQHFAKAVHRQLYYVSPDANDVLSYLDSYQPPDVPVKWL